MFWLHFKKTKSLSYTHVFPGGAPAQFAIIFRHLTELLGSERRSLFPRQFRSLALCFPLLGLGSLSAINIANNCAWRGDPQEEAPLSSPCGRPRAVRLLCDVPGCSFPAARFPPQRPTHLVTRLHELPTGSSGWGVGGGKSTDPHVQGGTGPCVKRASPKLPQSVDPSPLHPPCKKTLCRVFFFFQWVVLLIFFLPSCPLSPPPQEKRVKSRRGSWSGSGVCLISLQCLLIIRETLISGNITINTTAGFQISDCDGDCWRENRQLSAVSFT